MHKTLLVIVASIAWILLRKPAHSSFNAAKSAGMEGKDMFKVNHYNTID
jgi:hypothetical protein